MIYIRDMNKREAEGGCEPMSPTELAKAAGVKPQVIYNLIRQRYLPAVEVEVTVTRLDVPDEAAEKYLAKRAERAAK
jgi:predicted site-specific integrase-resolvase